MIIKIIKPLLGFIVGDYLEISKSKKNNKISPDLRYHSDSHCYQMEEGIQFRNPIDLESIKDYYVEVNENLEELADNPYIYLEPTVEAYFEFVIDWLIKVDKIRFKEFKEVKVNYGFNLCFFNIDVGYKINGLYAQRGEPYYLHGFFRDDLHFKTINEMKEFLKKNSKDLKFGTNYHGAYSLSTCITNNRYFIDKKTKIPNVIWLTYEKSKK